MAHKQILNLERLGKSCSISRLGTSLTGAFCGPKCNDGSEMSQAFNPVFQAVGGPPHPLTYPKEKIAQN